MFVPPRLGRAPICPGPYASAYTACPDAKPLVWLNAHRQTFQEHSSSESASEIFAHVSVSSVLNNWESKSDSKL